MFRVGQQVHYILVGGDHYTAEVIETTDTFVLIRLTDPNFSPNGALRTFNQNGAPASANFGCGSSGVSRSRIELINNGGTMFTHGQQVQYHYSSGIAEGHICEMGSNYILVDLTFPDGRCSQRVLSSEGRGPPLGNHWATRAPMEAYIVAVEAAPEWQPTPGREYPAEPVIGYGVFDSRGRPITPGFAASNFAGFGIINLPPSLRAQTYNSADDPVLKEYLRQAKIQWQDDCLNVDFEAVENKLEFLIGLKFEYVEIGGDSFWTEIRCQGSRWSLNFDYSMHGFTVGPQSRRDISDHIRNRTVTNFEGDKITLDDGYEFRMTSHGKPALSVNSSVRAMLMRNLAMQRAKEDSTLAMAA